MNRLVRRFEPAYPHSFWRPPARSSSPWPARRWRSGRPRRRRRRPLLRRGRGTPPPQFVSPEVAADRRISFRIYAPKAAGDQAVRRRHPRPGAEHPAHEGRERRLGDHRRPDRPGRLPLQLQRGRRGDDRPAQRGHQRVEQQRLEPRGRAGLGSVRHEGRAARRGGRGHLQVDGARHLPPDARLHAAGLRVRAAASIPSSTCCTAPATATRPGRRSAAPGSSSTT